MRSFAVVHLGGAGTPKMRWWQRSCRSTNGWLFFYWNNNKQGGWAGLSLFVVSSNMFLIVYPHHILVI